MKNFILDGQTLTMNSLNEMVFSQGQFSLSETATTQIKKSRDDKKNSQSSTKRKIDLK